MEPWRVRHLDRLRELAANLRAAKAKIDDIEATADSPDGLVRATVSGRGNLVSLELESRLFRSPDSKALAATIAGTIRAAQKAADSQIDQLP
jgi:DNA-binding protein YbaB